MLKIVDEIIDRIEKILKPPEKFDYRNYSSDVENDSIIIDFMICFIEQLGLKLPNNINDNISKFIKIVIAKNVINWMKENRPDVFYGFINICKESIKK